ncbi:molybdopterin-guanine dinucleotide biosynthesis protein [Nocardioides dongxiaopingii]|uniref:molybdenum cofactor guanylyltransferase n=1 Tax=Nocardioides sp. S-1144 TaxID=2582905 RepID=UPI00110D27A1|nr:NTP transferase domain-containing protein [Nocardioides sp. S-1144]QCW49278.1 molybdopterin-guanine dinucleotide biosynthesis protein [Nocardioides sp. S-1144]
MDPESFCAVVLAGGRGSRLGGVDKAAVEVDGRTLLAHALDAVREAAEVVVVGEEARTAPPGRPVTFVVEEPRHGGPAAGLLTGCDALVRTPAQAPRVAVVAVDMPRLTAATVRRLHAAARGRDGAVLVGPDGRRQLALVVDRVRLAAVAPGPEDRNGTAVWRLLEPLDLAEVAATGQEHRDVDTWTDVRDLDVP